MCAAMDKTFEEREKALRIREGQLAKKVYDHAVPKKVRDAIALVPPNFFVKSGYFHVNLHGWKVKLNFYAPSGNSNEYDRMIIQDRWQYFNDSTCPNIDDINLRNEFEALDVDRRTLKDEMDAARCKLNALLQSVTTFKRLREVWPEGGVFYEQFDLVSSNQLPVSLTDLNSSFGLTARIAAE